MKKQLKSVVALTVICAVMSVLLALTNYITAPIIAEQQSAATNAALAEVLPGGEGFETIDLSQYELPETIIEAYSEKKGGYVFKMETAGYAAGFVVMCGVDKDGVVTGALTISSGETLGYEKTYGDTLKGASFDSIDSVEVISGATKTTKAFRDAVKDALGATVVLKGGSVDLRDEAEILKDNLSAALPQANGEFEEMFIAEELSVTNAVYKAVNASGYVFVAGDAFVATDAAGAVISEANEEVKTGVAADALKVINSKVTEIDISGYDMPTQVEKAYKTESGNFVFELKAAGFGINGDAWYNPSGEYIKLKVSATADGKIINCVTISQSETDGIGSACADKDFYSQFNGKTETDYKEIDAISGATVTTNGYKTAVSKVFLAIEILKGVA